MDADDQYVQQFNRCMLASVASVFTVAFVLLARQEENGLYLVGAVASGALAVRAVFSASVVVSNEGFCYHGLFGKLTQTWDQILRFEVWEVRGNQGGRLAVLVMIERDDDPLGGRSRQLNLLSWPARKSEEAERVRCWLNGHLDAYRRRDQRR